MAGDTAHKGLNWDAITFEYISTKISYRDIAKKYGVSGKMVSDAAKRYDWQKKRKAHRDKTLNKALDKAATKEANLLAKEIKIADKISDVLNKALSDAQQFNRYLINESLGDGISETSEKVFNKIDMRALKDAAQTLKLVEDMKRSMLGILTVQQKEAIDINRERLALDKAKSGTNDDDEETGVVMLAPVLPEDDAEGEDNE